MVEHENQIIISLSDLIHATRRHCMLLLYVVLAFSFLTINYCLTRPITYKAEGVLKNKTKDPGGGIGSMFAALGGLGDSGGYAGTDDPKDFLNSYPVAERVVKRLNLQGHLIENKNKTSHRIIDSLLALKAKNHFSRRAPQTYFGATEPCPTSANKPFVDSKKIGLTLEKVIYPIDEPSILHIHFKDNKNFEVCALGKAKLGRSFTNYDTKNFEFCALGKGTLGQPFTSNGYTFSLAETEENLARRNFILFLSPLHLAAHKLQNAVTIAKDKKNAQLFKIVCRHTDPVLAAAVVNQFMQEYTNYLKAQGMEKISHQLSYLSQREQDVIAKLKTLTQAQGIYAKDELSKGNFTLLGDPKSAALLYKKACKTYSELSLKIQSTYESLFECRKPVAEIVKEVKEWMVDQPELVKNANMHTSSTGPKILAKMNLDLEKLALEFENYNNLSNLLDQEDFQLYALSGLAADLLLDGEIARLSRLAAGANHTAKERSFAMEEIAAEKSLIKERLLHLKQLQEKEFLSLKERIRAVQKELLVAFVKELSITEEDVADYLIRCGEHVDQLLFEHNAFLSKEVLSKFHGEILGMAEAKNLAYNLESIQIKPFEWAIPPHLPEPPKLMTFVLLGIFIGLFFGFGWIALREIYFGPTASPTNLRALGKHVVSEDEVVFELLQKGNCFALISKRSHFASTLAQKMSLAGKKTLLFNFSGKGVSCLEKIAIHEEKRWDSIELGQIEDMVILQSKAFASLMDSLKERYDAIIIVGDEKYKRIAAHLASRVVYCVSDERVSELTALDHETLYFHEKLVMPVKKTLKELIPILRKKVSVVVD